MEYAAPALSKSQMFAAAGTAHLGGASTRSGAAGQMAHQCALAAHDVSDGRGILHRNGADAPRFFNGPRGPRPFFSLAQSASSLVNVCLHTRLRSPWFCQNDSLKVWYLPP